MAGLSLAVVVAAGGCSSTRQAKLAAPVTAAAPKPTIAVEAQPTWTAADVTTSIVGLYTEPGKPDPNGRTMANPTQWGMPLVFLVKEQQDGWVKVQIPARPNGSTAWVRAGDVKLRTVTHRIEVSLSRHLLTVFEGNRKLFDAPVAIGTQATPTPLGDFYIDARVRLSDPTGAYGAGQLSMAAYSDVITSFGGGPGQVGIHGTNQPELIGSDVSNGCIRVDNDVVLRLLSTVPTGTPVDVIA